jgi:hypothetical protein
MLATILAAALLIAPLEPLHFLEGTWEATGRQKEQTGTGRTTFEVINQGHGILRRNYAIYPTAPRHDDVMIIYAENEKLRADYWDSEGHIIHYTVITASDGSAVFISDVIPKSPRFRLTYTRSGDGMNGKFEIASPANPETFAPYLAWSAHRVRE